MRFLTASQIFDGNQFLTANSVLVLNESNCLTEITTSDKISEDKLEKHDGIITPGFINAHCHLELSHLYKHISEKTGFTGFAKELMSKRFTFAQELVQEAMWVAEEQMWENGIVAVGDISNSADSFEIKSKSDIRFHTFIELIALNPALSEKVLTAGKELLNKVTHGTASLSPHAPYSVSFELMQAISKTGPEHLPLTIHNQESASENEFFERGTGPVLDLYRHLGIDISYYKPYHHTSLQAYLKNFSSGRNLILVHNTFSSEEDIRFAEMYSKNLYWCLCPNANLYIENTLPMVELLQKNSCKIVIGTDSLASNHHLSVLNELNTLLKHFPSITTQQGLQWATYNGACALNISEQFGALNIGKNSGLNLINLENNQFAFRKKLA